MTGLLLIALILVLLWQVGFRRLVRYSGIALFVIGVVVAFDAGFDQGLPGILAGAAVWLLARALERRRISDAHLA